MWTRPRSELPSSSIHLEALRIPHQVVISLPQKSFSGAKFREEDMESPPQFGQSREGGAGCVPTHVPLWVTVYFDQLCKL